MVIAFALGKMKNKILILTTYRQGQHANMHVLVVDKSNNIDGCLARTITGNRRKKFIINWWRLEGLTSTDFFHTMDCVKRGTR